MSEPSIPDSRTLPQPPADTDMRGEQWRAAQVDYFRIPRRQWGLILARLWQMGADTILAPLYWGWHEIGDGQFDLNGQTDPRRDLDGFIRLCAATGFKIIVQHGPVLDAGVLGNGVPVGLLRHHPELLALKADGAPLLDAQTGLPGPSLIHPLFIESVRLWIETAAKMLVPLQAPAGPIVAIQINTNMGQADHNPHVTGALWPVWLRKKYQTIQAVNEADHAAFTTFSQVRLADHPADAASFLQWYASYTASTYANMLHSVGWTAPACSSTPLLTASLPLPPALHLLTVAGHPQGIAVSPAIETNPDPPDIGAQICWGQDAPLKIDGSLRPLFWNIKSLFSFLSNGGALADESGVANAFQSNITLHDKPTSMPQLPQTVYLALQQDATQAADALRSQLGHVELRAVVVPASDVTARGQEVLSKAVDALDKASRYASHLRAQVEGRAETRTPLPELGRVRMTQEALAHLIAIREAAAAAASDLSGHAANSTAAALAQRLCHLRTDIQAGEIEQAFGMSIEQGLADLLYRLSNLATLMDETQ